MKVLEKDLTVQDVAEILSISLQKSYQLFNSVGFNSYKIGRQHRIRPNDFEEWKDNQR